MNETCLTIENLSFHHADEPEKKILSKFFLHIKRGEIVALLGQNGCGKTTLLNIIAGFVKPISGKLKRSYSNEAPIVFQESSLLPWKSASENIEFSLLSHEKERKARQKRVNQIVKLLGLEDYKDKLPGQLSGGLKQRVAIGRALAPDPNLILLDEPFSALDIEVKEELIKEIRNILVKQNKSAIFITHDLDEAVSFADRILVINPKTKNIGKEILVSSLDKAAISDLKDNLFDF